MSRVGSMQSLSDYDSFCYRFRRGIILKLFY